MGSFVRGSKIQPTIAFIVIDIGLLPPPRGGRLLELILAPKFQLLLRPYTGKMSSSTQTMRAVWYTKVYFTVNRTTLLYAEVSVTAGVRLANLRFARSRFLKLKTMKFFSKVCAVYPYPF